MNIHANKFIVFIFGFIFSHNAFAQLKVEFRDGYCENTRGHKHETAPQITKYDGITIIEKTISHYKGPHEINYRGYAREEIAAVYDKKDSLISYRYYIWDEKRLIQTIENGITRNIVQGKTPCDLTVIEPSSDSVFLHIDPKEKIKASIKMCSELNASKPKYFKCGEYDAIIYNWYSHCQLYYEKQKYQNNKGNKR
jgi:hypothetical protein